MLALVSPSPRERLSTCSEQVDNRERPPLGWLAWPVLALLAAYLLFCHGCHGDEDNELLVQSSNVLTAQEETRGH